jgi:hypothetical protein
VASKVAAVEKITGLDISEANVQSAQANVRLNGVQEKVEILLSDSYSAIATCPVQEHANANFLLANPPASQGDDGFGYRREVLRGAKDRIASDGVVFLSISSQYGQSRIQELTREVPEFVWEGILASTQWVPFDLGRADLLDCLEEYAREECRGGLEYDFRSPGTQQRSMNARAALEHFQETGESPLSKWQTHLLRLRS